MLLQLEAFAIKLDDAKRLPLEEINKKITSFDGFPLLSVN